VRIRPGRSPPSNRLGRLPSADILAGRRWDAAGASGFVALRCPGAMACGPGKLALAHRDPFDRLLAAQRNSMVPLVTVDSCPGSFPLPQVWGERAPTPW